VPDIWGWDSGRTRNIADALAANGWAVVRAPFTYRLPSTLLPSRPPPQGGAQAADARVSWR
jgi:predicted alpha/beta-hydrolase family hydrolase